MVRRAWLKNSFRRSAGARPSVGLLLPALLFALAMVQACGASAPRVLTQERLDRFIADFPAIARDFGAASVRFGDLQDPTLLRVYVAGMRHDAAAAAVLRKRGWGEAFYGQLAAVLYAYAALLVEDAESAAGEAIREANVLVDANAGLTDEQKRAMKAQTAAAVAEAEGLRDLFIDAVHPDDLALVRRNRAAIERMFVRVEERSPDNG